MRCCDVKLCAIMFLVANYCIAIVVVLVREVLRCSQSQSMEFVVVRCTLLAMRRIDGFSFARPPLLLKTVPFLFNHL